MCAADTRQSMEETMSMRVGERERYRVVQREKKKPNRDKHTTLNNGPLKKLTMQVMI